MEKQANYKTSDFKVQRTYTVGIDQVDKLDEMEQGLETNKSELVRMAIDRLYAAFLENKV